MITSSLEATLKMLEPLFDEIIRPVQPKAYVCHDCHDSGYTMTDKGLMFCEKGCHNKLHPLIKTKGKGMT